MTYSEALEAVRGALSIFLLLSRAGEGRLQKRVSSRQFERLLVAIPPLAVPLLDCLAVWGYGRKRYLGSKREREAFSHPWPAPVRILPRRSEVDFRASQEH